MTPICERLIRVDVNEKHIMPTVNLGSIGRGIMGGFASSRILEVHGECMNKRTFNLRFRIALHQKDLNLALQSARTLGVALPQTASAAQLMNACAALGHGQTDHSALVRVVEALANHEAAAGA